MKYTVVLLLAVALIATFASFQVEADTITVTGVIRDFWPCKGGKKCGNVLGQQITCGLCHDDFENYNGDDRGIPQRQLDRDGKPALNVTNNNPSVGNSTGFSQWFRTYDNINKNYLYNLTFDNTICDTPPCDPRVYGFYNDHFFPINNKGWGNFVDGTNFHFTFELSSRFTYQGGEIFKFTGDDDLWVYIDGKLVIDLGGVHSAQTQELRLDDLKLIKNQVYTFHIFFAERHTSASNFKAWTSIGLTCDATDRCNVCFGDGQSCCHCNDGNPCTVDFCDTSSIAEVCKTRPVECPSDNNKCTNEFCNPATGKCDTSAVTCNDNKKCTIDSCSPSNGCVYTPRNCDDDSVCTIDSCDESTGNCKHEEIDCDDNDPCTIDSCHPVNGCVHKDQDCPDDNVNDCTFHYCSGGACLKNVSGPGSGCVGCKSLNCSAQTGDNFCKPVVCDSFAGVCKTTDYNCNDNNLCTVDTCYNNATSGAAECSHEPKCVSEDVCQLALCNREDGSCSTVPVNCDDGNACTTDTCQRNTTGFAECVHTDISCDDKDACTVDSCDATTGCTHDDLVCDDGNPCTVDTCDKATGCVFAPLEVPDDGNLCTVSYCDKNFGIINSTLECRPKDRCTCDPQEGCVCKDTGFAALPPAAKGLSVTAIVLIVLGSVAGVAALIFGGKKGLDYVAAQREATTGVQNNPLYEQTPQNNNPLFENN